MLDPGLHAPLAYWPHVVLGIASVVAAAVAVFSRKAGRLHRRAGQVFSLAMGIAGVTALVFVATVFEIAPLVSSLSVIYGIVAGYAALRTRTGAKRAAEISVFLIPLVLAVFCWGSVVMGAIAPSPEPITVAGLAMLAGIVITAILFTAITIKDFQYARAKSIERNRRYRRHALRMALAATEVLRAPLITFGPAFGPLAFPIYFFGPLLLIPAIYFLAMPSWLREGRQVPKALALED